MKLRETIVPIEEWLQSDYYLGPDSYKPGKGYGLKKYWYEKICEYFNGDRHESIFSGSSRAGKTWAYLIIIRRYIYETYCIENFPTLFGLAVSTVPKVIFFSFSRSKASSVGINKLIKMIDATPWHQEPAHKRYDIKSVIKFPWIEIWSGTNASHAVGEDMIGAVIDEANVRHVAKSREVAEAEELYKEIIQRSYTTYSWHGKWGGFAGIISTAGSLTSFVDSKIRMAKEKGSDLFIVEAAVYDVDPDKFSEEKFLVFPGNSEVKPFVVDTPNPDTLTEIADAYGYTLDQFIAEYKDMCLPVPVDLKRFYLEDVSQALANLSGVSQSSLTGLFKKKSDLEAVFNKEAELPTHVYCPNIGIYDPFSIMEFIDEEKLLQNYHGEKVYSHADISKSNDFSGLSDLYWNEETQKVTSLLTFDAFYETSIPDNEVSQEKFYAIQCALADMGIDFGYISADQAFSAYYLQQCKLRFNINGKHIVGHQSVDEDAAAYLTVLNYAKQRMYDVPYLPKLEKCLKELIYDPFSGKVDHPENRDPALSKKVPRDRFGIVPGFYGKDISDAFAGASYLLRTLQNIDYTKLLIDNKVKKTQKRVGYYGEVADDEDDFFSSALLASQVEEEHPEDDIDKFERSLLGDNHPYNPIEGWTNA